MLPGAGLYTSVRPPPRRAARRRLASSAVAFLTVSCVAASTTRGAGRLGVLTSFGGCAPTMSGATSSQSLPIVAIVVVGPWCVLRAGVYPSPAVRRALPRCPPPELLAVDPLEVRYGGLCLPFRNSVKRRVPAALGAAGRV